MYTVLLPVDTSEARATAQATAAANLPDAANSVEVQLLHVFDDDERAETTSPTQVSSGGAVADHLESEGVGVEAMSRTGDPATEILRAAQDVDADLILLGGRKRSPLGSVLFGSVSQEVTLDADRPVVVTGDREVQNEPSHVCQSCGEEYHTTESTDIATCRNCGGTKVERVA
jgi:nucleotide-binding universal stress UspA family protein